MRLERGNRFSLGNFVDDWSYYFKRAGPIALLQLVQAA
jgi:hypothetical protein